MKLLAFLGVGNYEETTYQWDGKKHTSCFSLVASCHFLEPKSIILFLTEEAQQKYSDLIRKEIPPEVELIVQPVSHGKNETELWQIFSMVSGSVTYGEEVAFDVTNGLRSFPLVGLLVSAFLQFGLNVNLKAVLYGAYDVRDKSVTPNMTSMFDLTPMIRLLEWSVAADRFNRTGDARYLASLIRMHRKSVYQQEPTSPQLANALGNLAGNLDEISQSLRLIRPFQTMETVEKLPEYLQSARPALERASGTLPFSLLLDRIEQSYAPLGMAEPLDEEQLPTSLEIQRAIITWYIEREQWVQAVTLSREWLVSWFMVQQDLTAIDDQEEREEMEKIINDEAYLFRTAKKKGLTFCPAVLSRNPEAVQALDLWNSLTMTRNDIDHAGMRLVPGEPEDLIRNIRKVHQRILALPVK